jgi:hypothetical protein
MYILTLFWTLTSQITQRLIEGKKYVHFGRLQLKCDGTRWCTEGEVRGNRRMEWVASTLHTTSEHGVFSITTADAHTSAASSRLNWLPRWFKWTRPFRRKTKSCFCACAITFQLVFTIWRSTSPTRHWASVIGENMYMSRTIGRITSPVKNWQSPVREITHHISRLSDYYHHLPESEFLKG